MSFIVTLKRTTWRKFCGSRCDCTRICSWELYWKSIFSG